MNLYAYVGNDPVNATDPTGMIECDETKCTTQDGSFSFERGELSDELWSTFSDAVTQVFNSNNFEFEGDFLESLDGRLESVSVSGAHPTEGGPGGLCRAGCYDGNSQTLHMGTYRSYAYRTESAYQEARGNELYSQYERGIITDLQYMDALDASAYVQLSTMRFVGHEALHIVQNSDWSNIGMREGPVIDRMNYYMTRISAEPPRASHGLQSVWRLNTYTETGY